MRYSYFEIENFKGVQKVRLDFAKPPQSRVNALVGLNESGKTTILEAINWFSYRRESLDPLDLPGYSVEDIHDLIPIARRANFNGNIVVRAGVELSRSDMDELAKQLRAKFSYQLRMDLSTIVRIEQKYAFENSRHDAKKTQFLWTVPLYGRNRGERKDRMISGEVWQEAVKVIKELIPAIIYYPNFLFDFPDKIYLEDPPAEATTARALDSFYRKVLQDILDSLKNDTNLTTHVLARAKSVDPNDQDSLHALLLEMGRSVTQRVFGAWKTVLKRPIEGKEIVLDINKDEAGLWFVRFRIKDADGYFAISERSLGFRWFFVYLLLTSYRGFRKQDPSEMLFLLDEPASNLHQTAQAQLLSSFENLSTRCVLIYTTHSHHLINPKWLESTFVVRNVGLEADDSVENYNAKKTKIEIDPYRRFAAQHPDQSRYFQPVLDVLDYSPSRIENIPHVLMVEGKNDFYTLNYIREVILNDKTVPNLMPGGGAGSLDTAIRLYLAWGRNFVIILDGDDAGKKERTRYEREFGAILSGKVSTLRDVDATWDGFDMERLFDGADVTAIQTAVFPSATAYSKRTFNLAVQELYIRGKAVELSDVTLDRFRKFFDFAATRLGSP